MADIELDLEAEEDAPDLDLGEDAEAAPASEKPGPSIPESLMIGAEQGIPFAPAIAAAMETGIDFVKHPSADLAQTYDANRANRLARAKRSAETNPWAHGIGSAVTGIGTAIAAAPYTAIGAAGLGARALGNAIVDTGFAAAQRMNEGENPGTYESLRDMLFGRAIGKGISGVAGAVANPKQTAGRMMEGAQNLYDAGMGQLGKIGKALGYKGEAEIADAAKSSKVLKLEEALKNAENFKPNPMDLFPGDAIEHGHGTSLPYRLAAAAKEGKADLYDTGFGASDPSFADDMMQIYDRGRDVSKSLHYPETWTHDDVFDSIGKAQAKSQQASKNAITQSRIRDMRADAGSGSPNTAETEAAYNTMFEREDALSAAVERYKAFREDASRTASTEMSDASKRAQTLLEQMKQADATAGFNSAMKSELDTAAGSARDQLSNIKTGRSIVDQGSPINIAKTTLGFPGGRPVNLVQKMIDFGGAQGQRMANAATLAQRWSTRDDNLGRMARWALAGDAEGAVARLAILADMPEAQEAESDHELPGNLVPGR